MGCCASCCNHKPSFKRDIKVGINRGRKVCVWILGGPGSGKGTQCKLLASQSFHNNKLIPLSIEDLLQNALNQNTPFSNEIRATMESRGAVDTETELQLLYISINDTWDNGIGYLIDGYPKSLSQAELVAQKLGTPHVIIYLACPDDVLVSRLEQRGQADDNPEAIEKRLQTFHSNLEAILQRWKEIVVIIDGTKPPEEVVNECQNAILEVANEKFTKALKYLAEMELWRKYNP